MLAVSGFSHIAEMFMQLPAYGMWRTLMVWPMATLSGANFVVGTGHVPSAAVMQAPPTHCDEAHGHQTSPFGGQTCTACMSLLVKFQPKVLQTHVA